MFFTLLMMSATLFQFYKIRSVCSRISKQITNRASIVFYYVSNNDIINTSVSSELCANKAEARIDDFLWYNDYQRGCAVTPTQRVELGPWISFPEESNNFVPFDFKSNNTFAQNLRAGEATVNILIETGINPALEVDCEAGLLIEDYGQLVAWKIDSHIGIIIKSNLRKCSELITAAFLYSNRCINDRLPIIRIETVETDGEPQLFDQLQNHLKKQILDRALYNTDPEQYWEKHLIGLKNLGVLACQAIEFEYNKNLTEGKTGVIVKPDLISSKNIEDTLIESHIKKMSITPSIVPPTDLSCDSSPDSPKLIHLKNELLSDSATATPKSTPRTSPMKIAMQELALEIESTGIKEEMEPAESLESIEPDLLAAPTPPVVRKLDEIKVVTVEEPVEPMKVEEEQPKVVVAQADVKPSTPPAISTTKDHAVRPSLQRIPVTMSPKPILSSSSKSSKPPNVLVYSDSIATRDQVIQTLKTVLEKDIYTIYALSQQDVKQKVWIDNTTLLIVCGNVEHDIGQILLEFFLAGGKLFCMCSDLLHIVLPNYKTAEVREHELVQFSYGRWQKVKMMHHIFCYQPSPVKKHFSHDGEEPYVSTTKPMLVCPRSVELKDLQGTPHNIQVQVLGTEETWNTPSLMLANNTTSGGKAVFSQIHLEADPGLFEDDEKTYKILKENDKLRLEIMTDLLSSHLGIVVMHFENKANDKNYVSAYFLGRHEMKFELLTSLKAQMTTPNVLKTPKYTLQFCGKGDKVPAAGEYLLPIQVNTCPDNFSTVEYFDNLNTTEVGRLVIYAPVMTSSMNVINHLTLSHGICVIARRQTSGVGRSNNQWLSPDGCLMFSTQLHIPLQSPLGSRVPLLQHLIAVAIVHGITTTPGYEDLNIKLKWPNDIIANGTTKIGGLVINSAMESTRAICNVGVGLNLSNSNPTLCIHDVIKEYNTRYNKSLPLLTHEKTFALIFNEIEMLLKRTQTGDFDHLYELYYNYWLHSDADVTIVTASGVEKTAKVIGIDDYGYLLVKTDGALETVHPDGNSFDMLRGLIAPKVN